MCAFKFTVFVEKMNVTAPVCRCPILIENAYYFVDFKIEKYIYAKAIPHKLEAVVQIAYRVFTVYKIARLKLVYRKQLPTVEFNGF